MDMNAALTAFATLGHPTRLAAFRALIKAGEAGMSAGEIGQALKVRQNTMSVNLSGLVQSGLVRNAREGRSIRYFIDPQGISGLLAFLLQDCCGGRPDLCQPLIAEIAPCVPDHPHIPAKPKEPARD